MRNNNTIGLIFSNMHDEVLRDTTAMRAMGSVPFGGRYRLIDFALSNLVNAGIPKVGVVTKRNYQSLMDHLGSGKAWDLSRKNQGLYFLPPVNTSDDMYNGRIASLAEIHPFLRNSKEEYVVMTDCYVVGNIDLDAIIEEHVASGAEITIAYKKGQAPGLAGELVLQVDTDRRVRDILLRGGQMSPNRNHDDCCYGMGLYVLRKDLLMRLVDMCVAHNQHHFERDILQRQVDSLQVYGYEVPELTLEISSPASYFEANMALLDKEIRDQLFLSHRPVYTKVRDCPPALYGLHAQVSHSLVADGCKIDGTVTNSIIFRDVQIGREAHLENCIVMQGTKVGDRSSLSYVVMDKNVQIQEGRMLQGFSSYPIFIAKEATV